MIKSVMAIAALVGVSACASLGAPTDMSPREIREARAERIAVRAVTNERLEAALDKYRVEWAASVFETEAE